MHGKKNQNDAYNDESPEAQSTSDVEDVEDYRKGALNQSGALVRGIGRSLNAYADGPGGYHRVYIGEKYKNSRYTVLKKLGWGHFSTVWLVLDAQTGGFAAMKVQKSASHYTEAARDEVKLLDDIQKGDPQRQKPCVHLLDHFEHLGPHGLHVCMVFEVLGDNLLALIKRYDYKGIPLPIVQNMARQMLVGLDYLHRLVQSAKQVDHLLRLAYLVLYDMFDQSSPMV